MNLRFRTEEELIKACLKGNQEAQRQLYEEHVQAMYNTAFRYTGDQHHAEDVLQEGFSKVFRYLKKFDRRKGDLKSWIRKIIIRSSLDFLKGKKVIFIELPEAGAVHDEGPNAQEDLEPEYILKVLKNLPERERVIFNLFEIEGYSHAEIAENLQININSCRVYLARAKNILKDQLEFLKKKELLIYEQSAK